MSHDTNSMYRKMSSPDSPEKSSRLSRFIRVITHQSSAQSKAKTHLAEPPAAQSHFEAQQLPTPPTTPQWSVTDQSLVVGRTIDSNNSTPKSFHVRDKVAPQEPEVAAPRPSLSLSPSPRVQVLVNDLKKLQKERRLNQGLPYITHPNAPRSRSSANHLRPVTHVAYPRRKHAPFQLSSRVAPPIRGRVGIGLVLWVLELIRSIRALYIFD